MATNTGNLAIGSAVVQVSNYVAAGGAGSFTDVGHTKGPTTLAVTFEDYELKSEQAPGVLRKVPISAKVKVKVLMNEATMANLRIAMRQPAANVTGTTPNFSLAVGQIAEQYHQVQVISKGVAGPTGVNSTRTITIWKAVVESVSEVSFGKGIEQTFEVTFDCLYDESVATADKFLKVVDTLAA